MDPIKRKINAYHLVLAQIKNEIKVLANPCLVLKIKVLGIENQFEMVSPIHRATIA